MIETNKVCKSFDGSPALSSVSLKVADGEITGLVGTNGAGKSTLLRLIAGVLKPDGGEVTIDGEKTYDNPKAKSQFVFISDDIYFLSNATAKDMARYYQSLYPGFDDEHFDKLLWAFGLNPAQRIQTFS